LTATTPAAIFTPDAILNGGAADACKLRSKEIAIQTCAAC